MKGNRQGSLSRSITRRSDQNRKIKYCFYFAILPQLVKKVRSDFFDKLRRRKPSLLLIGRVCHCKRLQRDIEDTVPYCFRSSFSSMRVNSSGRGQCSSTGSPVRGWRNRSPVAWRH